jgi:AraC-like DNA-binding protein
MTVEQILHDNRFHYSGIRLGEVQLLEDPSTEQLQKLNADLQKVGFELLDDQRKQQIERIKNLLIKKIQQGDLEEHFSLSKFLSKELYKDYSHLSKLFSEVEGITIEQFFILQKVEKVKEWLVYNESSLNEIALNLGYSSVQHLSMQFKKVTGMTPSHFKKIGINHRKPLDGVH